MERAPLSFDWLFGRAKRILRIDRAANKGTGFNLSFYKAAARSTRNGGWKDTSMRIANIP